MDLEIGKNEDGKSTDVTVRQELNSSGKEGSDLVGGGEVSACTKDGERDV